MDDESLETSVADHEPYRHDPDRITEVKRRANRPLDQDGRSPSDTFFYHDENTSTKEEDAVWKFGDKYENKWEWLNQLHEEHYSHGHNESREPALAKRDIRTWMNQLECHDHQIEWACQIYDSTSNDPDDEGYVGGRKYEGVLLAIITLVLNTDVSRKVRDEQQFQNIRESCDVSTDTIKSVRKDIRHLI